MNTITINGYHVTLKIESNTNGFTTVKVYYRGNIIMERLYLSLREAHCWAIANRYNRVQWFVDYDNTHGSLV